MSVNLIIMKQVTTKAYYNVWNFCQLQATSANTTSADFASKTVPQQLLLHNISHKTFAGLLFLLLLKGFWGDPFSDEGRAAPSGSALSKDAQSPKSSPDSACIGSDSLGCWCIAYCSSSCKRTAQICYHCTHKTWQMTCKCVSNSRPLVMSATT